MVTVTQTTDWVTAPNGDSTGGLFMPGNKRPSMLTSREVAVLDANAAALGVSRQQLMESSGAAVARTVQEVSSTGDHITIVAGRGNNGGDGLVAARYLSDREVSVRLLGRPETIQTEIARDNWRAVTEMDIDAVAVPDSAALELGQPAVIVDAMLGTGITGSLREPERTAAERINDSSAPVVSVDVPTGVDADTGEAAGAAVTADRIITFHERRVGLDDWENVTVADIGIPEAAAKFTGPGDRLRLQREPDVHKGECGRLLIIGGGPYVGAPVLAGLGAYRAGADLVRLAVPETIADAAQSYAPELIVDPVSGSRITPDHVSDLVESASSRDVTIIGPGLGSHEETRRACREFLSEFSGKAVVDADALSDISAIETNASLLCTPHQGELREMGGPSAGNWRERAEAVETFARELGQTLLVKGQYDIISDGETTRVNRTGSAGMSVGGTGDVLAGVAGALFAVLDPVHAGALAAFANGRAGEQVADESGHGFIPSDLVSAVPQALWETNDE